MKIRHWRVGNIDLNNPTNTILPTKKAIKRLKKVLKRAYKKGKDVIDIITGPEVLCQVIEVNLGEKE